MPAPKAVREQEKLAEQLIAQQKANAEPAAPAVQDPGVLAATNADDQVAAAPAPNDPAPPNDESAAPPPRDWEAEARQWEERWKSMKSSHDQTVPQLRSQLAQLMSQHQAHERERAAMQQQISELQNEAPPTLIPPGALTEDEASRFDEDMLGVIAKVANAVADRKVTGVAGRVESLQTWAGQTDQERAQIRQEQMDLAFDGRVRKVLPDADSVDSDPGFAMWLNEIDPLSGRTRRQIAEFARRSGDVGRVVSLYQEFQGANGNRHPDTREQRVEPRHAAAQPVSTAAPQPKMWTDRDIDALYKEEMDIKPHETERLAKFREQEKDLFAAMRENRYRA